jgi:hypothetical protein
MTETGDIIPSLPVLDQGNLWMRIREAFYSGRGVVRVLSLSDNHRQLAFDMKVIHGSRLGGSEDAEDYSTVKVYAFQYPPLESKNISSHALSHEQFLSDDTSSEPPDETSLSSSATTHYIYQSQFIGDRSIGGSRPAQLSVISEPRPHRPPLFRWI